MRAGIGLSAGLHAGVLAVAFIGLPSLLDSSEPVEMAIAVEMVSEPPEAKPPPEPEPQEIARPEPEPAKPPPPEPAPEPPPQAEPVPEPVPEPEPKPKPKPKPKKVDKPPPPMVKPKPVRQLAARAVPTPRRKPKPPPDAFDTLLRDLEQRRKAAPKPPPEAKREAEPTAPAPQRRRQNDLRQQRLTAVLVERIREQVWRCWNPPIGVKDSHKIRVTVRIALNPDGTLVGRPRIVDRNRLASDPVFQAYAESAVRALQNPRCTPLRLPFESYEAWRTISLNFDTRELLQ